MMMKKKLKSFLLLIITISIGFFVISDVKAAQDPECLESAKADPVVKAQDIKANDTVDCRTADSCIKAGGQPFGTCGGTIFTSCCHILNFASSKTPVTGGPAAVSGIKIKDPLNGAGLYGIINRLITTFLGIIGAFALLAFVIAGIIYMTAGGEDKRVTQARDIMKYTVIGLAIIVLAYALESLFFRILGVA